MKYTLMHKNTPVIELDISEMYGHIEKHGDISDHKHLPPGTTRMYGRDEGRVMLSELNDWWLNRSIPASRDGIREALDFLISNEDRHYNNFGFLRNAETLEWLGTAPVFDNGTSLWYNTPHIGSNVESKPFRSTHAGQIKLVNDFTWFDADKLDGIGEEIKDIFETSDRVDETRRSQIALEVTDRCRRLDNICRSVND